MSRLSCFICVSFLPLLGIAATGDTLKVRTHQKVLIQTDPSKGHTEYPAWGVFPTNGKTYQKMYAELTFQCPPGMSCGEWDYLNYIFIGKRRGKHNDTLNWEVIRFITPYGLQFNSQWKHTWRWDITDFASLFTDSVEIWYQHTGYEAKNGRGWLITLDFTMIEGPEIRPVKSVKQLWRQSVPYGNDSLFDARVPEVTYKTGPGTSEIRYKIIQTGHGMDKPENCAEFCPKQRYLRHDAETDTTWVWRDNCGENPVFPQAGTWIYDRTNWCPGADVQEYNLDKPVAPGTEHTMDLDMQTYTTTSGGANYMITTWLVEYGPHRFTLDASVEDVIRPSSDPQYQRLNPSCGEPRIIIRNNGNSHLHSLVLDYGWEGMKMQRYTWTGLLRFGETDTVDLPWVKDQPADTANFVCEIIWTNGRVDEYAANNKIFSRVTQWVPTLPSKVEVVLRTNNAASENYYTIHRADGTRIARDSGFANNTINRKTYTLEDGCYLLSLMDDGTPPAAYALNEDGLGWWANTFDGSGTFQLRNGENGSLIRTFAVDFGTGIWYQFRVGPAVLPHLPVATLKVYPNPAKYDILVDLGIHSKTTLNFEILDMAGNQVFAARREGELNALQYFNIASITRGIYVLRVNNGGQIHTEKIILH